MKVNEMITGGLYKPTNTSVYSDTKFPYYVMNGDPPKDIKRASIWSSRSPVNNNPLMLYLGYTREIWKINNIGKHHWFLVNGDLIVLNHNSFRHLEIF